MWVLCHLASYYNNQPVAYSVTDGINRIYLWSFSATEFLVGHLIIDYNL